jgi:uncharacterized membrane protein YfcA
VTGLELAVVAGAVFVAAVVQVLSGFGFALLAVPLMTFAVDAKQAVVISTLMGAGVSSWQAWHGRSHTERAVARRMVIAAYCGMPLGLLVFLTVDDHVLRLLLGIAVLTAVVLLAARIDLRHAGSGLDAGAGFLSGVLNTSLSTNGPPLVFALQARHLAPDAFRATINTVFAFSNLLGLTLFIASGKVTREGVTAAAIALPALLVGQLSGYPLRRYVHGERFRVLVLLLLTAAAMSAIISAMS